MDIELHEIADKIQKNKYDYPDYWEFLRNEIRAFTAASSDDKSLTLRSKGNLIKSTDDAIRAEAMLIEMGWTLKTASTC